MISKHLNLNPNLFRIFVSLLGNHILPYEDLASFHWSLCGPEHPVASIKVLTHQLILALCDVVIKAMPDYIYNIKDTLNLEAITKDVVQNSKSRTDDKVTWLKRPIGYYSEASKPVTLQPPHYLALYVHVTWLCLNESTSSVCQNWVVNNIWFPGWISSSQTLAVLQKRWNNLKNNTGMLEATLSLWI